MGKTVFRDQVKRHNFACVCDKQIVASCVERIKKYAVILKELGCFIQFAKFEQAERNPQFFGFQFPVCVVFGVSTKKIPQKIKKRIYRNRGHFRSLHMLLDLCRKNEGNPFSTNI